MHAAADPANTPDLPDDATLIDLGAEPQPAAAGELDPWEELELEVAKWKELSFRTAADLDNLRKRTARDREDAIRYANQRLFEDLIPVIDNFEMGMQAAAQDQQSMGIFDQHNGYALAELFQSEHLAQFEMVNFSDSLNSEVYQLVKRLYAEQLLVLFNHSVLVPEMLTLEAEKRSRDKTIVRAPVR